MQHMIKLLLQTVALGRVVLGLRAESMNAAKECCQRLVATAGSVVFALTTGPKESLIHIARLRPNNKCPWQAPAAIILVSQGGVHQLSCGLDA